jgi:hypothetical protein
LDLQNRAWVADLNKGHKLEDDGLRQAKYDIVHKGWTNKWGGFHWVLYSTHAHSWDIQVFGVDLLRWVGRADEDRTQDAADG